MEVELGEVIWKNKCYDIRSLAKHLICITDDLLFYHLAVGFNILV